MELSKEIFRVHGRGLGDCISDVSRFIHVGLERNQILRLALFYVKERKKYVMKLKEVVPIFENDHVITLVDEDPTEPKVYWKETNKLPLVPSKVKWVPNRSKVACYQFDGKAFGSSKNFPSKEAEDAVLDFIKSQGYQVVRLGGHISIADCVKVASESELFVGVESGMAYLCGCVGLPCFHIQNSRPREIWDVIHGNKHWVLAKDGPDFNAMFSEYTKNPKGYYLSNANHVEYFRYSEMEW